METQERDARLAALAQQIAAVEARAGVLPGDEGAGSVAGGSSAHPLDHQQLEESSPLSAAAQELPGAPSEKQQTAAAKAICLRLLAVAPRPRAGLAQAMKRKDVPDQIAEAVLDRLTEVGLIDDVAYAQSYVRVKQRDRALGRTALRNELRKLGVGEEIMASAVDAVDADAERARAAELVGKRLDAAMEAGPVAARRRLLGLLSRRGYSFEIAVPVVDEALQSYASGADELL